MGVYISLLVLNFAILSIHEMIFKTKNQLKADDKNMAKRLSFLFILVSLGTFSAVRDGIGIDYSSYLIHIERIYLGFPSYMELGFQYLSKIIMKYIKEPKSVIAVSSFLTCYFFISAIYKQSKNIKMSIYLFLTWGYYFFTFNTVRNYLALSIALFAISYVFEKKYIKFTFWIIIAFLFHKSALICLPIYIIANREFSKKTYLFMIFVSLLLFLFKSQLRTIAFWVYPMYEGSVYDSGRISIFNILKSLFVQAYGMIYYRKVKEDHKLIAYFNLNFIALIIYTALYWLPEISRIGFYFNIVSILFIPNLTSLLNKENRLIINFMVYSLSMILFILLMSGFYSPTIQLLPYKTWIFN